MNRIAYLAAGVASADRSRARIVRQGVTPGGDPLWSHEELDVLRRLHPDYPAVLHALGGRRSYSAVRHKAQKLGLVPKRNHWTADQVSRLRRVYRSGSIVEVRQAFPDRSASNIQQMARYFGFKRPRKPFIRTGYHVIDQIRDRCFELCLSMTDLDAMAGTGTYFAKGGWHSAGISARAVARAVRALDGELSAIWNDDADENHNTVVRLPPVRSAGDQALLAA